MTAINATTLPPPPPGWQHRPSVRYGDWNSIRHCAELAEKVKKQEKDVDDLEILLHVKPTIIDRIVQVVLFVPAVAIVTAVVLAKITIRLLRHFGIVPKPAPVQPKPTTTEDAIRSAVREVLDLGAQRKKRDALRKQYQQDCLEPAPKEAPVKANAKAAFWATTPFQLMGATQRAGELIEATDRHIAEGFDAVNTQVLGAAAFLGLVAAAAYRLRFGDTSLLQRLIPAL